MLENNKIPRYDIWYRKYGIRRQSQLFQPHILKGDSFLFPMYSVYHNSVGMSESPIILNRKTDYLRSHPTIFVREIFKFRNPPSFAINKPYVSTTIISNLGKKEKTIKFLKDTQELPLLRNTLFVYDYGYMGATYKYKYNRFKLWEQYKSYWDTIFSNVDTKEGRIDFVRVELPDEAIPFEKLLMLFKQKEFNMVMLKTLRDFKSLNYFELIKLFNPETKHNSIFNLTNKGVDITGIDFLLTNGKNAIHIPFTVLYSILTENAEEINIKEIFPGIKGYKRFRPCLAIFNNFITSLRTGSGTMVDMEALNDEEIDVDLLETNKLVEDEVIDNEKDDKIEERITTNEKIKEAKEEPLNIEEDDTEDIIITDEQDPVVQYAIPISAKAKKLITYKLENIDLEKVGKNDNTELNKVERNMDFLFKSGQISSADKKSLIKKLEEQKKLKIEYVNNTPLKDIIDQSKDDITITNEETEIKDTNSVLDKNYNKNILNVYSNKYVKNIYKKDLVRSIYGIQNGDAVVSNYKVETTSDYSGTMEKHSFDITIPGIKTNKAVIFLPKVEEDGTYRMDGNTYRLKLQRRDDIIRKIDYNIVALSTYYGKLMITKGHNSFSNISSQLLKIFKSLKDEGVIENLIITDRNMVVENVVPKAYSQICYKILGFKHEDIKYTFDYINRGDLFNLTIDDALKLEKDNVLVGIKDDGKYVYMDMNDNIIVDGNNIGNIYDIIGIDLNDLSIESLVIKVLGRYISIGEVLLLYYGIDNLLKVLNSDYVLVEPNKRVSNSNINIKFKDITYSITKENNYKDNILNGIAKSKATKDYGYEECNKRERVFDLIYYSIGGGTEIKKIIELNNLENFFIDPISAGILKSRGIEPNFPSLLIEASKLLDSNYNIDTKSSEGMVIKGYERVAGMVYQQLAKSIASLNGNKDYGKKDLEIDPYYVKNTLCEDSTSLINDDLNPIAENKIKEDITQIGLGGLQKDSLRTPVSRKIVKSNISILSDSVKDSGDTGINNLAAANINITNLRGDVKSKEHLESWADALSTTTMLAPFVTHDDTKRMNFFNIQSSHVIPINNSIPPYIRTGYESIIPFKTSNKYCISAEGDGVVTNVTANEVVVKYAKGGEKKYKLYSWTSKEETHACYTHYIVTNLKKGDKVAKDDIITYDQAFFAPDLFNPKRVIYKQGNVINLAFVDDETTYEDSICVSKSVKERLSATITKIVEFKVNMDQDILNLVKVGDRVEIDDHICSIMNHIVDADSLDEETLKLLKEINTMSPKTKYRGIVSKMHCIYNFDPKDASPSIRKLIQETDKQSLISYGYTGKVNPSYRMGKDIMEDNSMIVRIYILVDESASTGDKLIIANQLKCTIGTILDEYVKAEDGTDIEALFSFKSMGARIVLSPLYTGLLTKCLSTIEERAISMYFK